MADFLRKAAINLARSLRGRRGIVAESIIYRRGASSVELSASRGSSQHSRVDVDGNMLGINSVDFLVNAENLSFEGASILPRANDEIEDSNGVKYRVSEFDSDGCFRYSDTYRTVIRIHTTAKQ